MTNKKSPYTLAGNLMNAGILVASNEQNMCSYACTCCRLIWDVLSLECRQTVEMGERHVKDPVMGKELKNQCRYIWDYWSATRGITIEAESAIRAVTGCVCLPTPSDITDVDDPNYDPDESWDYIESVLDYSLAAKEQSPEIFYDAIYKLFEKEIESLSSSNRERFNKEWNI